MPWEPFALAVLFGLLISALLHLVLVWPRREPDPARPADAPDAPDE